MEHIKQIYDALNHVEETKLYKAVRLGRHDLIAAITPMPLDRETSKQVLQYAKELAASKMSEPYNLADYVYYIYDGTPEQFAESQGMTIEDFSQAAYSGHVWSDGGICAVVPIKAHRKMAADNIPQVADFVAQGLLFGEGRSHVRDMWAAYIFTPGAVTLTSRQFSKALEHELKARGYPKTPALRIGDKVSTGYDQITVKTV